MTSRLSRPAKWLSALLVSSIVLAGCSSSVSGVHKLTGNELKYGASPEQNSSITYQPDVVLVGGADSVKSVSADGMVWTISGSAPNVGELQPGKIMFASSFGVGRILAVSQVGADKRVVIGPVAITDVVRDGDFSSTSPISLSSVEAYSVPNQPGLLSQEPSVSTSAFQEPPSTGSDTTTLPPVQFVAYEKGQRPAPGPPTMTLTSAPGTLPTPSPSPAPESVGAFHMTPFCCAGGVGVHVTYDQNGTQMTATVTMHLNTPKVKFNLDIANGKLVNAGVKLTGAGGFGIAITAATTSGLAGDIVRQRVQIPVDFRVPVTGIGLPITLGLSQVFGITTAFTARDSIMGASGNYTFSGALGFGINNGSASAYTPKGVTFTKQLSRTMNLKSIGPASVVIKYAAKLSADVGLLGFGTGVWFDIAFNTTLTGAGSATQFQCEYIAIAILAQYGVGYHIPKPVEKLTNVFLSLFHAPPIKASGGYTGPAITVLTKSESVPPIEACASGVTPTS